MLERLLQERNATLGAVFNFGKFTLLNLMQPSNAPGDKYTHSGNDIDSSLLQFENVP